MLRTISVTNRISSAAAVLLPNDQDLCAARPAGVPPRRQGALFDPRNQNHYGPSGIEGLVKVICTFRCRLSLDAPFTSLQRATVAGSKVSRRPGLGGWAAIRIVMLVPTQIPAKAGSMMAFGQRRMISPDLDGAGAVMI